ncbi:hypothetical protein P389DRAFT_209283 [Cystobasidium minutum MCA 4210]|uniref:uncharacterized protein n=1 Tax=Cystobasidium minutum MCA 4210 TaxID=1397322 RepID=UPI0034CECFBE|eukprot:jgi/Rhomi1/209283/estExt_Genemark1.C_2_t30122
MASTDGIRRIKTYGKHKSSVAVSRREWWNTVSEGTASTSTLESSTCSRKEATTSPSHRAAKKSSSVIDIDEDDDEPVPSPPRKHVPLPRAQNRSINNRSRIVDISDSNSDDDYKPSTSKIKSSRPAAASSLPAKTPANAIPKLPVNALGQQEPRQRVVSLSSDTSEEDKIRTKPAKSKTSIAADPAIKAKKRIIIEDTPPASPLPAAMGHVVSSLQNATVEPEDISTPPAQLSPLKATVPKRVNVLARKDSNLSKQALSTSSSPVKKPGSSTIPSTTPAKTLKLSSKASMANESVSNSKENVQPSSRAAYMSNQQAVTPAKSIKAVTKAGSKPVLMPSRVSASSSSNSSRTTSSHKSGPSSSASIALPPPRGHKSASTVAWRRPLAPISAARPKTKVSTLSSIARKVESASPMPVRSAAVHVGHDSARSSASRVVVEIPFGLPRSRSPAPSLKEPRRRQASSQSTASSSSRSSIGRAYSPLASSQYAGSPSTSLPRNEAAVLPAELDRSAASIQNASADTSTGSRTFLGTQATQGSVLEALASKEGLPQDFKSLLDHCDGLSPEQPSRVLDFASFVANPLPLYPEIPFGGVEAHWSKLGEATFSEVFIVTNTSQEGIGSEGRPGIVVKVIPLHMPQVQSAEDEKVEEAFAKNEEKKNEAFTTSIDDLAREIRIFRALSEQDSKTRKGWPGFRGAYLVRGRYPETLLSSWDTFKQCNPKKAENPRPDAFASNQIFALICMEHAGVDLESVKLASWSEAATVLWQVSSSLSQAEQNLRFEHRDLHWGNILVERRQIDQEQLDEDSYDELPSCLSSGPANILATIIDFTLSRADVPKSVISPDSDAVQTLSGGFDDECMFTGEGDYQFECYRIMKRLVQDKWEQYCPDTNIVWLHYLVQKLLSDKGLKKPVQRAATRTVAIKANLPGTPIRSRTRRGAAAIKKPVKAAAQDGQALVEKEAYESLLAARTALKEAIAHTLKSLPRSTSLTEMMAGMKMGDSAQGTEGETVQFNSAGDFVDWWRSL